MAYPISGEDWILMLEGIVLVLAIVIAFGVSAMALVRLFAARGRGGRLR